MSPSIDHVILNARSNWTSTHPHEPTVLVLGGESLQEFRTYIKQAMNYTGESKVARFLGMAVIELAGGTDVCEVSMFATYLHPRDMGVHL